MCAMRHKREGLLAQIEAGVLDDTVPLSSLLQKCIVLGGQARSEKMRDWARRELNGYAGVAEKLPDYRLIRAGLTAVITNTMGYNPITQRIHPSVLPAPLPDWFREEGIDLEDATMGQGIGVLEALANRKTDEHKLIPPWAEVIVDTLNEHNVAPGSHVAELYWSMSSASIQGLLVRVRTALAELVAELASLTPEDQAVPDKGAADAAIHFVVTGDRNTINYSPQQATGGGANIVTVSGEQGTAIGSQTASGANSSVVGSQTGDHNAVAGRDATDHDAEEQAAKEGWWTRLRKRGVLVAIFTIVAGVIAVFTWIGWTPWS
jgi:hypothetical protein